MTYTELKKWRSVQIAATILYRICGKIRIERQQENSYFYELLVTLLDEKISFGVKVASSTYLGTAAYKAYIAYLEMRYMSNKDDFKPVVLMCVNEQSETAQMGIQIGWFYNRPIIIKKVKLHAATERIWPTFRDNINMMYNTIRSLALDNNYIVKILSFDIQSPREGIEQVKVIYLRQFTDHYRINKREPETDKERRETMMEVIRQDEYPQQETLDLLIKEAINNKFGASIITNRMLLFTSDLKDLRDETNHPNGHIRIEIQPQLDPAMLPYINGLQLTSFTLPIYSLRQETINMIDGLVCPVIHELNDFIDYSSNIKLLLATLKRPADVVL